MIRLKKQLTILFILPLALANRCRSEEAIDQLGHSLNSGLYVDRDQITQLSPIELAKHLEVLLSNFLDIQRYPEISLRQLGDTLIYILEVTGEKVPSGIKQNIKSLINIKKSATSVLELKAGHQLANTILLQLVELAIDQLSHNHELISRYVSASDLLQVKRELFTYKREIEHLTRQGKLKEIPDLIGDIKKIAKKMDPVWQQVLKNQDQLVHQVNQNSNSATISFSDIKTMEMIKIFRHRINQNQFQ